MKCSELTSKIKRGTHHKLELIKIDWRRTWNWVQRNLKKRTNLPFAQHCHSRCCSLRYVRLVWRGRKKGETHTRGVLTPATSPSALHGALIKWNRFVEIVFIHANKGSNANKGSKILNIHALCSQNIRIVPEEHAQFGANVRKNRSFDARKWPLSFLFPSRILLLVRPPTRVNHLHKHSLIIFSSMANDLQRSNRGRVMSISRLTTRELRISHIDPSSCSLSS